MWNVKNQRLKRERRNYDQLLAWGVCSLAKFQLLALSAVLAGMALPMSATADIGSQESIDVDSLQSTASLADVSSLATSDETTTMGGLATDTLQKTLQLGNALDITAALESLQWTPGCANVAGFGVACSGADLKGDMNRSGELDLEDLSLFAFALLDRVKFAQLNGFPPADRGDVNRDGAFDYDDIDAFQTAIVNCGVVPEPSSLILVSGALMLLLSVRNCRRTGSPGAARAYV